MKKLFFLFAIALTVSCGGDDSNSQITPSNPAEPIPVNLSVTLTAASRATDNVFEDNDQIGLYMVNYEGSTPGTLKAAGNQADNISYTYESGSWRTSTSLYWKDATTHADFYVYYPYQTSINSVSSLTFSVKTDQSTKENYTASDFLWGKTADQAPTAAPVNIQTRHLMSSASIRLAPGEGFTEASLAQSNPVVTINGTRTNANINLSDGTVSVSGQPTAITPLKRNDEYLALIVPQTVEATNFINVNIDGRDYQLSKNFTFEGGKRHTFTVTVMKTSSGINVGITQWETDDVDNGGVAQ